ncbi:Uncharacterised protein [Rodentibacter pneumotropicus]|uniref:Uncharacterized protein n=1 Tax=Rodentibacter pneumotropicus TaxID=758 RepID=A0A448MNL2_9PAST|nr:Uncharacterised protein [Rodentibacter pneumotropicus]
MVELNAALRKCECNCKSSHTHEVHEKRPRRISDCVLYRRNKKTDGTPNALFEKFVAREYLD